MAFRLDVSRFYRFDVGSPNAVIRKRYVTAKLVARPGQSDRWYAMIDHLVTLPSTVADLPSFLGGSGM